MIQLRIKVEVSGEVIKSKFGKRGGKKEFFMDRMIEELAQEDKGLASLY